MSTQGSFQIDAPGAPAHRATGETPRLLLKPDEAAEVLGIGRSTLYELLAESLIESVQIGRSRRIPVAALEAYVERLRNE